MLSSAIPGVAERAIPRPILCCIEDRGMLTDHQLETTQLLCMACCLLISCLLHICYTNKCNDLLMHSRKDHIQQLSPELEVDRSMVKWVCTIQQKSEILPRKPVGLCMGAPGSEIWGARDQHWCRQNCAINRNRLPMVDSIVIKDLLDTHKTTVNYRCQESTLHVGQAHKCSVTPSRCEKL